MGWILRLLACSVGYWSSFAWGTVVLSAVVLGVSHSILCASVGILDWDGDCER